MAMNDELNQSTVAAVVPTYQAQIHVGLRDAETGKTMAWRPLLKECQRYVDEVGLCVTLTATTYIYRGGRELGAVIGLINYPRFPASPERIKELSLALAKRVLRVCRQQRVTVVFPEESILLVDEMKIARVCSQANANNNTSGI